MVLFTPDSPFCTDGPVEEWEMGLEFISRSIAPESEAYFLWSLGVSSEPSGQ